MQGRNNHILHYHYRVYPKLVKYVCYIFHITCACSSCVAQLDKYWLENCAPSSQSRYARVDNFYYNKIIEYYNYWIIVELLDIKTPKV